MIALGKGSFGIGLFQKIAAVIVVVLLLTFRQLFFCVTENIPVASVRNFVGSRLYGIFCVFNQLQMCIRDSTLGVKMALTKERLISKGYYDLSNAYQSRL